MRLLPGLLCLALLTAPAVAQPTKNHPDPSRDPAYASLRADLQRRGWTYFEPEEPNCNKTRHPELCRWLEVEDCQNGYCAAHWRHGRCVLIVLIDTRKPFSARATRCIGECLTFLPGGGDHPDAKPSPPASPSGQPAIGAYKDVPANSSYLKTRLGLLENGWSVVVTPPAKKSCDAEAYPQACALPEIADCDGGASWVACSAFLEKNGTKIELEVQPETLTLQRWGVCARAATPEKNRC